MSRKAPSAQPAAPRKPWNYATTSRHARGYGTAWVKLRAEVLAAEPLCRMCMAAGGVVTAATHVDHITPKAEGGTDDRTNLQPLCAPHHAEKSLSDRGAKPRRSIAADGWPIE